LVPGDQQIEESARREARSAVALVVSALAVHHFDGAAMAYLFGYVAAVVAHRDVSNWATWWSPKTRRAW
jgi:hypothetical protein